MSQHHTNADAIQVTKVTVSTKSSHAPTLMNVQMETTTAVITQSVIIFPPPLNATALLVSVVMVLHVSISTSASRTLLATLHLVLVPIRKEATAVLVSQVMKATVSPVPMLTNVLS